MFRIGWDEILLIAVILVIVVKPEQLPDAASALGRFYSRIQRLIFEARLSLEKEIEAAKQAERSLQNLGNELKEKNREGREIVEEQESNDSGFK